MSEFLSWYQSLAPEGETALIVRQKPILKDGELQYHGDGAIKCSWPAQLPTTKIKEGGAYYGNTGSYIIDRFVDGKISASRDNIEYCLVMVLDDIGTKSNIPPLAPTWIMETSPGNYQWGYAFGLDDQPKKGEFTAAIVAIAEAGYTDKGATNAVRNFRLPGSVNIKPDKNGFASRLVDFHPGREYTLEQICTALGVTPAEADTVAYKPISVADNGADDVLAWLSSQGLVIEGANSSGWTGVICPNHAEHSDGNPMGRYHPANRAYCCLHEHCSEWNSEAFLHWVEEAGGPSRQAGLRDDLIAGIMAPVLAKLEKGDVFSASSDAEEIIKAAEARQVSRYTKQDLHKHFAYVASDNSYFDLDNRTEYTRPSFDAIYRHLDTRSRHGKSPRITASNYHDETRVDAGGKVLTGITYAPGEDVLVAHDGGIYGNKWVDARGAAIPGDVSIWLKHCEALIPNKAEREHVLNVLAYKVQHPETKVNHALLIGGKPGVGKDTLLAPFLYAMSGLHFKNLAIVDSKRLESGWGYAFESEVILINELRPDLTKDRRALENTLKPIIAAPPDFLEVNRKGLHPYKAINRLLVLAMTNFKDAIALPSDDRRWFVTWCEGDRMPESDAMAIWSWYKSGGFAAIAHWLSVRDVSAFNPGAAPMMTEAKAAMIESARSGGEEYLISLIQGRIGEFASGVIGAPFHAILDRLQSGAGSNKLYRGILEHALNEAGWHDRGMVDSKEYKSKKRIYCAPDMMGLSKAELRRMVEIPPTPTLSKLAVVK